MTEETKAQIAQALLEQVARNGLQAQIQIGDGNTQNMYVGTAEGKKPQESAKPAKQEIMEYVGRLKPVIAENVIGRYEEIWLRILDLEEVRSEVYDRGRQQGTSFNRNLVANIIHLMVQDGIVTRGINDVQLTELLEPEKGKNHPVRSSLGLSPETRQKRAIEGVFKELDVKVRES